MNGHGAQEWYGLGRDRLLKRHRIVGRRARQHAVSNTVVGRRLDAIGRRRRQAERCARIGLQHAGLHAMIDPEECVKRLVEEHAARRHIEQPLFDRRADRWMGKFLRHRCCQAKIEAACLIGRGRPCRPAERIVGRYGRCTAPRVIDRPSVAEKEIQSVDAAIDGKPEVDSLQSEIGPGLRGRGLIAGPIRVAGELADLIARSDERKRRRVGTVGWDQNRRESNGEQRKCAKHVHGRLLDERHVAY